MSLEPHHRAGRTRSWREEQAIAAWEARRQGCPSRGSVAAPEPPNTPARVFADSTPEQPQHGTAHHDTTRSPK